MWSHFINLHLASLHWLFVRDSLSLPFVPSRKGNIMNVIFSFSYCNLSHPTFHFTGLMCVCVICAFQKDKNTFISLTYCNFADCTIGWYGCCFSLSISRFLILSTERESLSHKSIQMIYLIAKVCV